MKLIADSGSTKTSWALAENGKIVNEIQTQGLNPYFTPPAVISGILEEELAPRMGHEPVEQILFYGAGCSTDANKELIRKVLSRFFPEAGIGVYHDILGAARALFGHEKGIACILGTGCNSCLFDGEKAVSRVPSLGYLYGDEGAGSHLGKQLLEKYLKNKLPHHLREAFDHRFHLTLEEILNALYNKPFPNRFLASFSPFLNDHIADPFVRDLVYFSFIEFIQTHITGYDDYFDYPTAFVGSIAFHFQDLLREAMASGAITVSRIAETPIEGLAEYHK